MTDNTPIEFSSEPNPRLKEARERWNAVKDCKAEKEYREKRSKNLKYFTGEDQGWDEDGARAQLKEEGRPAISLNRINPIFRLIQGARPKTEGRFLGKEQGDMETAPIINACNDHIRDDNHWDFAEDEWFRDMAMLLRAVVEIKPNYDRDVRGEVEFELEDGNEFYLDPDSKKAGRWDGRYLFRQRWVDPEEVKRTWPKLKDKITNLIEYASHSDSSSVARDSAEPDEYQDPQANYYDKATKKLAIVYYWYKDTKRVSKIIDSVSGTVFDSPESKDKIEKELQKLSMAPDRFKVVESDFTTVRYLVFSHDIDMEEGVTPWEREDGQRTVLSEQFPFVIAEPERIHSGLQTELVSLFDPLFDPQKYHNKLASAILHIIGTTAHSGWEYEEGAISPQEEKRLKKHGSKAGHNIKWAKGALTEQRARRIQPGFPPQAHMMEAKQMASDLLDISGIQSLVNTESLGKGASGKAIALKQTQGGNIISWLYKSFRFFQFMLTRYTLDAIQVLYDYEKVIRITGNKTRYVVINQQVYDYSGAITQVLNDVTTGKFDVTVTEKDILPTMRQERFQIFAELVKSGALQLPPEVMMQVVLELMDDPDLKDLVESEMSEYVTKMQQMQAQQAQAMAAGGMVPQPQQGAMA